MKRYTIGEVSKISGLSKDSLRFYDKIDLLKPNYVDTQNNYRYYSYDQFWLIDIISCCRKLNVPLEKIKEVLSAPDNSSIAALLKEHREEAKQLSNYYKRVALDIDWYIDQSKKIKTSENDNNIRIEHFPKRRVIYGENREEAQAYHLKLQEAARDEVRNNDSIKRRYGYSLNPDSMWQDFFDKRGEYIEIESGYYSHTAKENIITLPAGEYVCCVVNIYKKKADFSVLTSWLDENKIKPTLVIADEIGLQLLDYTHYPCEIRVFLN